MTKTQPKPFSQKTILRFCVVMLVLVALAGGYYEVLNENWQATYNRAKTQWRQTQTQPKTMITTTHQTGAP